MELVFVFIWKVNMPGQKIETGHQDVVHDVAMEYYGKRLATTSSDNTIKIIGVSNSTSQHLATLAWLVIKDQSGKQHGPILSSAHSSLLVLMMERL